MYGLFPAMMETQRYRADQEQRAAEMAMRQQDQAMRQQEFGVRKQEFDQRLADAARARKFQDDLVNSIDAEDAPPAPGMPMVGAQPGDPALQTPEVSAGGPPSSMPMASGSAGVRPRLGLSGLDRAAMRTAAASGNLKDVYAVKDRAKAEGQDAARKTEFKRLMGLSEQDLVAEFEPMNAHPGVKGMLNFDPKTKQFLLVSQIPGLDTQSMTKEELVNSMIGIWEAGNGDFDAGMTRMMQGAQRRREIDNSNYDRSGKLAGLNADAYFKGRQADSADAQWAEQTRHNRAIEGNANARLGLERTRAESADWKIIGTTADKKGLLYFNERTRQTEARPMPEGTDAEGLFRKLPGQRGNQMSGLEQAQAYKAYVDGGMDPTEARALVTGVDIPAMVAGEIRKRAEAKTAGVEKPAGTKPGTSPPPDPIQSADFRTLQRIASIPGHAMQRAAQAEIERRAADAPDTSGFGYGLVP